ncbi:MAG: hypothetical protein RDV41_13610 [Planctomycetota bacterium]|nr:hypothetical protein [Planctomycetota bacterium]
MLVENMKTCISMLRDTVMKIGGTISTIAGNPKSGVKIDPAGTAFSIMQSVGAVRRHRTRPPLIVGPPNPGLGKNIDRGA